MTRSFKILFLSAALLLQIGVGRAQPPMEYKSTLVFESTVYDFGHIEEAAGRVSCVFRFTNTGDNTVAIEHVAVSCGCTTPEYPRKPIRPGEKGEVRVIFDPENRPGEFEKTILLTSNTGKNRNLLTLKGVVEGMPRPVEQQNPFMLGSGLRLGALYVNMRQVEQQKPTSTVISYANLSDKDLTLDFEVNPNDGWLTLTHPETICAGCQGEITVTARIPAGGRYGSFNYRLTPVVDGKREGLTVNVSAIATDNFSAQDAKRPKAKYSAIFRHLGEATAGARPSAEFTLTNEGDAPLNIRAVEGRQGIYSTLRPGTVVQPGKKLKITLTLDTTGEEPGLLSRSIMIVSDDPDNPVYELRVAVNVK